MGSIRLLLALAVALYHSYGIGGPDDVMTGGTVSVQAFYIISGFYMALILHEKYKPGPGSYRLFITSRILRIYPAYWACLVLVVLMCVIGKVFWNQPFYLWYWTSQWDKLSLTTIVLFILANLFLLGSDWLVFTRLEPGTGQLSLTHDHLLFKPRPFTFLLVPQIWSVGVEISFYLFAPLLLRSRWYIQLGIILASLALRWYIMVRLHWNFDPWTYRFFPTEIAFFLSGSLAYLLYKRIAQLDIKRWIPLLLWVTTITAIALYPRLSFLGESSRCWWFYGFFFVCLPFIFRLTKNSRIDRFIGELSFPVYIGHHFIMYLWRQYFFNVNPQAMDWFGILTALSSVVFAVILWFCLLSPIEKYRQRRFERKAKTINFTS